MPKPKIEVDAFDLKVLTERGVSEETIRRNELKSLPDRLEIRYRDLETGQLNGYCRQRFHGYRTINGKSVRYFSPTSQPPRPYLPAECVDALRDGSADSVFVTESEIKALALAQHGHAAIGLSGVDCWRAARREYGDDGSGMLHPEIAQIVNGRPVYVTFDYDQKETAKRNVARAKRQLASALRTAGATQVYDVVLPPADDGAKQGVDDYLAAHGPEALAELVDAAQPMPVDGCSISSIYLIHSDTPTLRSEAYHGLIGEFLDLVEPHTEATAPAILAHLISALCAYIGPGPHVWGGGEQPARINNVLVGTTSNGRKGTSLVPVAELMKQTASEFWDERKVGGLSTGEGLIQKLSDDTDKRLLVVEPEFARVLAHSKREGNILSAVLRECYDSGDLSILTRTAPLLVKNAHLCVVGHITPAELKERFSQMEQVNGFGNRLLWWYVFSDKMLPDAPPFPRDKYAAFSKKIRDIRKFAVLHPAITKDESAAALWREIYAELRSERPGFVGALTARGESIVLRLALLYALCEKSTQIKVEHLEAALAVWEYNCESVRLLFSEKTAGTLSDKLYRLLAAGPKRMAEFYKHTNDKADDIRAALAELEAAGKVKVSKVLPPGPGRPAEVYERVSE